MYVILIRLRYLYALRLRVVIHIVAWYPRLQLIHLPLIAPDHEAKEGKRAYAGDDSNSNAGGGTGGQAAVTWWRWWCRRGTRAAKWGRGWG